MNLLRDITESNWKNVKDVKYWRLEEEPAEIPEPLIDCFEMIIKYHQPKEKEETKEETAKRLEKIREQNRIRQQEWRDRQKERREKLELECTVCQ